MSAITTRILGAAAIGVMVAMPAWSQDPAAAPQAEPAETQAVVDEWMYGYEVMSEAEREAYRERVRSAPSDEAREQFRRAHRVVMTHRARERGIELAEQPRAAISAEEWIFGYEVMSEAEREAYRERVRSAPSDEARARFQGTHRTEMISRARERGVTLSTEPAAPAAPAAPPAEGEAQNP